MNSLDLLVVILSYKNNNSKCSLEMIVWIISIIIIMVTSDNIHHKIVICF